MAWRLWKTESRQDTYLALVLVGLVSAPFVAKYLKHRNGGDRR